MPSSPWARHAYVYVSRGLSCIAALVILTWEISGSRANWSVLTGISIFNPSEFSYPSAYILTFLAQLTEAKLTIISKWPEINATQDSLLVLYLDKLSDNSIILTKIACSVPSMADYLYESSYIEPTLKSVLAEWNGTYSWAIVDCSFHGRLINDTTTIKLYLLDNQVSKITTLVLQTLTITRPKYRHMTVGGLATLTTTLFESLKVEDSKAVSSRDNAVYWLSIGFEFPYRSGPFEPVKIFSTVPPTGEWQGILSKSGETLSFAGSSGMYRGYPDVQASFDFYYWDLPSDPLSYIQRIVYYNVRRLRDSWSWFRLFLGLGIGVKLVLNMTIALVISLNMWNCDGTIWLPDIYPSIQNRVLIRSCLLFLGCYATDWWYPYQSALNHANYRNHIEKTIYLEELPRIDCLMATLAVVHSVALASKIRVRLFISMVIYAVCFYTRHELVAYCGIFRSTTDEYSSQTFYNNIVPGNGGMDLWIMYENTKTEFSMMLTESTWLIIAIAANVIYVFVVALGHHSYRRKRVHSFIEGRNIMRSNSVLQLFVDSNTIIPFTIKPTQLEQNICQCVSGIHGIAATSTDYTSLGMHLGITPSGVWLLGYLIVDDRFVININDYPYLVVNMVMNRRIFRIYGYALQDDLVDTLLSSIQLEELTVWQCLNISLKVLR